MNCSRCSIRKSVFVCYQCEENPNQCEQCCEFLHSLSISQSNHKIEKILFSNEKDLNKDYNSLEGLNNKFIYQSFQSFNPKSNAETKTSNLYNFNYKDIELNDLSNQNQNIRRNDSDDFIHNKNNYKLILEEIDSIEKGYNNKLNTNRQTVVNSRIETRYCSPYKDNKVEETLVNQMSNRSNVSPQSIKSTPLENNDFYSEELKINNNSRVIEDLKIKNSHYINNLKKIYQEELNDLCIKNDSLVKILENTKESSERKIVNLENLLKEKNIQFEKELNEIQNLYESKISHIISEKDHKINYLTKIIEDAQYQNSELLKKLSEVEYKYKMYKEFTHQKDNNWKNQLLLKELEFEELKKFLDLKVNYLESEKNESSIKLSKNNEKMIQSLLEEYSLNKKKYEAIIIEKENEITSLVELGKKSDDYYTRIIEELRTKEIELKTKVMNIVIENESNSSELKLALSEKDKAIKQCNELKKSLEEIKENFTKIELQNIELKAKIDKISGIKFGKFKV